jgi:hypothetical protein
MLNYKINTQQWSHPLRCGRPPDTINPGKVQAYYVQGYDFFYGQFAYYVFNCFYSPVFRLQNQYPIFRNDNNVLIAGIQMRKEQIAIIALALWLTIVSVSMLLSQWVDLEVFFVLCLLGFLVITQLIQPSYIQPGYLKYFKYLIAAGIVIFGLIVVKKVMEILA